MAEESGVTEGIVCGRCMTPNDPVEKLCTQCGAPLGDFGSTAPWEYGKAREKAYHEPTSPRKRPVILAAAWLLFGSPALYAGFVLAERIKEVSSREPVSAGGGEITFMIFGGLYVLASAWVLWVVTRGFLRKR